MTYLENGIPSLPGPAGQGIGLVGACHPRIVQFTGGLLKLGRGPNGN